MAIERGLITMREIPGVDSELLERLYLVASAKARIVAAERLLIEARDDLRIAEVSELDKAAQKAVVAALELREKLFEAMDSLP
jgi:hypothetical protein